MDLSALGLGTIKELSVQCGVSTTRHNTIRYSKQYLLHECFLKLSDRKYKSIAFLVLCYTVVCTYRLQIG